ncbi:arabinosyltransferase, partial [Hoyosella rhizosphaerae]|nr:arabinosyltransferase [Hoyosella rhizosphaerae]
MVIGKLRITSGIVTVGLVSPGTDGSVSDSGIRTTRLVALVTGLLGFLLAVAAPLLPVHQTNSTLTWPQNDEINSVEAPLISYYPQTLAATVPCSTFAELPDEGGIVASTIPPASPDSLRFGMQIRATGSDAQVVVRNGVVASVPRDRMTACDELVVTITKDEIVTEFTGVGADDDTARTVREGMFMPQVVGVFTDLTGTAPTNLNLTIDIDSRFSTHPTT